jgi:leucyl-tRNA synthetase
MYGHRGGLIAARWPVFDAEVAKAEELEIPVQVNGKLRSVVHLPADADAAAMEAAARADEKVIAALSDKQVRRVITVPGRLVNFVVG